MKFRWGVSKAALLYRGRQLGVFTDDQLRAGYITLKRHGEALEEREDAHMPHESPEVVAEGLQMMSDELGVPLAAVARKMGVQPRLLSELLGQPQQSRSVDVVNLFGPPENLTCTAAAEAALEAEEPAQRPVATSALTPIRGILQ